MAEHNRLLRAAREARPSRLAPGEPLSRAELAEEVNAWLWQSTGRRYDLGGHHIAKYERGVVRRPIAPYRAALRAVLGATDDADLGFPATPGRPGSTRWSAAGILDDVDATTRSDVIDRRNALRAGAALGGAALLTPLLPWLDPLATTTARAGSPLAETEVEAFERVAVAFRGWRGSGLGRGAVAGQLTDVTDRRRGVPEGALTDRAFLVAAELAKIAAAMAVDAGAPNTAQRHYRSAVQLAAAGHNPSFAAVALAALARQSLDRALPRDALEIIGLARRGSDATATPALRAMLATREAWAHAHTGDRTAFERAVDTAEQAFTHHRPAAEPHWLAGFDAAELTGVIGARYRDLAHHHPAQATRSIVYIDRALQLRAPGRDRNRAFDLIGLARTHLLTGDPDRSADLAATAVPLIDPRRPGRLASRLRDWYRESQPYADVAAVSQTRTTVRPLIPA